MWTKGEATKSGILKTAVPPKTKISWNIPVDFQKLLPDFRPYIIQRRKKILISILLGMYKRKSGQFLCALYYVDDVKGAKAIIFWIVDHEMQHVAEMMCFTAERHMFETYITVIIEVT